MPVAPACLICSSETGSWSPNHRQVSFIAASRLVTFPGHRCAPAANQKIEVRTLVRLENMLDIESLIPSIGDRRWRRPRLTSAYDFVFGYAEFQFAGFHVQRDLITVSYQRQWPTDRRFRRHVQHNCSVSGSAHARIGYAHHVGDSAL